MGITGLLPLMSSASTDVPLSRLENTVAAVDTNGWIHRACYSCADKIYLNEPTEMYIHYCINYCQLLRKHHITPILVFDGQSLPAKSETKLARQRRKQQKREDIEELLRTGQESQARWLMRQCVDVTFDMVRKVIERCRQERIDYLVAPYEADAQITYLVNSGLADYAITEDSDLLAFGCRRALYKLDRETERGRMIDLDRLNRCFKNIDLRKFQLMCILSGCDYVANIPNVGIGRAKKFFEAIQQLPEDPKSQLNHLPNILRKLPETLKLVGKVQVTDEYIDCFIRACNTFDHQIVYSPQHGRLIHLNPLKPGLEHSKLKNYAGDFLPNNPDHNNPLSNLSFTEHYILGNICTKTLKQIDSYEPDVQSLLVSGFSPVINERIIDSKNNSCSNSKFDPNKFYNRSHSNTQTSKTNGNKSETKTTQPKKSTQTPPTAKTTPTTTTQRRSLVKQSKSLEPKLLQTEAILDEIRLSQNSALKTSCDNSQGDENSFTTIKSSSSDKLTWSKPIHRRYNRNMFSKSYSDASTGKVTKSSKYFANSDDDDAELIDHSDLMSPATKRQKSCDNQHTPERESKPSPPSSPLLNEQEIQILKVLNNPKRRSGSLSSSQYSSTAASSSQSSIEDSHIFDDSKISTVSTNNSKKVSGNRKSSNNNNAQDIRKYFLSK